MALQQSRRKLLALGGVAAATLASGSSISLGAEDPAPKPREIPAPGRSPDEPFGYCLNTATIMGANLTIVEMLEIAARAGYHAVEPWIRDIEAYEQKGGSL